MRRALIVGSYRPWIDAYRQAFAMHDIKVTVADPTSCVFSINGRLSVVPEQGKVAGTYDFIVPLEEDFEDIYYSLCIDPNYGAANMLNGASIRAYPQFSNKFHQYQLIDVYSRLATPISHFSINPGLLARHVKPEGSIAKILRSSRGRGVFEVSAPEALIQIADEYGRRMLVQDFIKTDPVHSYRTMLLGGESLGTVRRIAEGKITTNATQQTEQLDDPPFVAELQELANQLQLDICGIDYAIQNSQPIIFEINRFPYFGEFAPATGINVAEKVVGHLLRA